MRIAPDSEYLTRPALRLLGEDALLPDASTVRGLLTHTVQLTNVNGQSYATPVTLFELPERDIGTLDVNQALTVGGARYSVATISPKQGTNGWVSVSLTPHGED